jgi:hypothetical protein
MDLHEPVYDPLEISKHLNFCEGFFELRGRRHSESITRLGSARKIAEPKNVFRAGVARPDGIKGTPAASGAMAQILWRHMGADRANRH